MTLNLYRICIEFLFFFKKHLLASGCFFSIQPGVVHAVPGLLVGPLEKFKVPWHEPPRIDTQRGAECSQVYWCSAASSKNWFCSVPPCFGIPLTYIINYVIQGLNQGTIFCLITFQLIPHLSRKGTWFGEIAGSVEPLPYLPLRRAPVWFETNVPIMPKYHSIGHLITSL